MAICRIWRGWATPANAPLYQELVWRTVIPGIEARRIEGFQGIDLTRRDLGEEIEFMTIMWFESVASIKAFVGEDHEVAHVPAEARALLARFDERALHYEVLDRRVQR